MQEYQTDLGEEFEALIRHLVAKVIARVKAGDTEMRLTISPERNERYGGRIGLELGEALAKAGVCCNVRQWTGPGIQRNCRLLAKAVSLTRLYVCQIGKYQRAN